LLTSKVASIKSEGEAKMKKCPLIATLVFASTSVMAQTQPMYPEAPEKWSTPEPIIRLSDSLAQAIKPTVTADGKTLYFGSILVTHLTDTGWSRPKKLPDRISYPNYAGADNPVISPDGKRLFFDWYGGGWYLYYADWDSTTNDWGPVQDPGAPLNNPQYGWGVEWGCASKPGCMPDDSTLIITLCNETFISYWHAATATWDTAVSWPYISPEFSGGGVRFFASNGIAVTADRKKVYMGGDGFDTTSVPWNVSNWDLVVTYRDTTNMYGYKYPYYNLNISITSDSLWRAGVYKGLSEMYPTITGDGKLFSSWRITIASSLSTRRIC
jgi:hypothetical protein